MLLSNIKKNQKCKVIGIKDDHLRMQLLRFGLQEGSLVIVNEIISHGPVLLQFHFQEIAIGFEQVRCVEVLPVYAKVP